jgi:hypothetical protein
VEALTLYCNLSYHLTVYDKCVSWKKKNRPRQEGEEEVEDDEVPAAPRANVTNSAFIDDALLAPIPDRSRIRRSSRASGIKTHAGDPKPLVWLPYRERLQWPAKV